MSTNIKRNDSGIMELTGAIRLPQYTVATVPTAASVGAGTIIYVSDGLSGAPTGAFTDGTTWFVDGSTVAIST